MSVIDVTADRRVLLPGDTNYIGGASGATITVWACWNGSNSGNTSGTQRFIEFSRELSDSQTALAFGKRIISQGNGMSISGRFRDADSFTTANFDFAPTPGICNHYAGVVDCVAETATLYVNGEFEQTVAYNPAGANNNGTFQFATSRSATLFGYFSNDQSWRGNLEDLRLYRRALSAAEIQDIYARRGMDSVRNDLRLQFKFNEKAAGEVFTTGSIRDSSDFQTHSTTLRGVEDPIYREARSINDKRKITTRVS